MYDKTQIELKTPESDWDQESHSDWSLESECGSHHGCDCAHVGRILSQSEDSPGPHTLESAAGNLMTLSTEFRQLGKWIDAGRDDIAWLAGAIEILETLIQSVSGRLKGQLKIVKRHALDMGVR